MKTKLTSKLCFILVALGFTALPNSNSLFADTHLNPANGNGRYFTDENGKAVYLTGSHTWNNFLDGGWEAINFSNPDNFDYEGYLDWMEDLGHNFIRLWTPENAGDFEPCTPGVGDCPSSGPSTGYHLEDHHVTPTVWVRDSGTANDGLGEFDLDTLNQSYFDRLRARIICAKARHIYVSVMLFDGWGVGVYRYFTSWDARPFWLGHPFNTGNNIDAVTGGDTSGTGNGLLCHTGTITNVNNYQHDYVLKVLDTVKDLDNVLFEISNESAGYYEGSSVDSTAWQHDLITFIHEAEEDIEKNNPGPDLTYRHPVGMTFQYNGLNDDLTNSEADWISPAGSAYRTDPPESNGDKVLLLDTDHLGPDLDRGWVWKSLTRGYNPIYMDQLSDDPDFGGAYIGTPDSAYSHEVRDAMGDTRCYADRMNLIDMTPQAELSSTGYVLAKPGEEYLAYQPENEEFTVSVLANTYAVEWFNPETGYTADEPDRTVIVDGDEIFTPPEGFEHDAVLYLTIYERDKIDHRPRS